jgi:hypothetical protein
MHYKINVKVLFIPILCYGCLDYKRKSGRIEQAAGAQNIYIGLMFGDELINWDNALM